MDTPAQYDLSIDKGRDFREYIGRRLEDDSVVVLTDWSFLAQIREGVSASSTLIAEFTIDTAAVLAGDIYLVLTDTETGSIAQSVGYWDLRAQDPTGLRSTWLYGKVTFNDRPSKEVAP